VVSPGVYTGDHNTNINLEGRDISILGVQQSIFDQLFNMTQRNSTSGFVAVKHELDKLLDHPDVVDWEMLPKIECQELVGSAFRIASDSVYATNQRIRGMSVGWDFGIRWRCGMWG
jgi:hypothetical protein